MIGSYLDIGVEGVTLPQDTMTTMEGLSVLSSSGADVTLDADGSTVHVGPGRYHIEACGAVNNGVGTTDCGISAWAAGHVQVGPNGSGFGVQTLLSSDNSFAAQGQYQFTGPSTLTFKVRPKGGSGDDTLNFIGITIFKVHTGHVG